MPESFDVSVIDLLILVAYIILTRLLALWLVRGKSEDTDGFFLGGRTFIWPLIGFSLFATNMSGASFVGMAGAGYSSGIAVYSYEWMAAVILVIFVIFLLPFYLRSGVFTMPEFLERRFDRRSRYAFAGLLIFLGIFLDCAGALYAGGLVVQTLWPAIPLWVGVAILALLAGVLSIMGGLGAVVISDTIQGVVLIIGGVIIFVGALMAIPSWEAVEQAAPEGALSIIQPLDDPFLPWPGLLGVLIIGVYFWTTNQLIVQRTLGAKTLDHGRWGSLFAGLLKLPPLFIMVLPGVLAIPLYPDLRTPDLAFPTLVFDLLPIGVRGIILAALVAAITSTVDSILNSNSTLVTMDFVRPLRPQTTDRQLVLIGRVTTAVVMLIGIVWAPQIINFPSLWNYFQSILAYATPPVVAIFFAGILWRKTTAAAAFWTFVIGLGTGVTGFILNEVLGVFEIHFLYAACLLFVYAVVLLVVISNLTPQREGEEVDQMIWKTHMWHDETKSLEGKPAWQNYRYQSVALLLVTAALIIWWW
jgi:SSS family solute:Na+ symporter